MLVQEAKDAGDVVMMIDELHTLVRRTACCVKTWTRDGARRGANRGWRDEDDVDWLQRDGKTDGLMLTLLSCEGGPPVGRVAARHTPWQVVHGAPSSGLRPCCAGRCRRHLQEQRRGLGHCQHAEACPGQGRLPGTG